MLKPTFSLSEAKSGISKKSILEIPASVEKVRTFSIKMLEGEHCQGAKPCDPECER